MSHPGTSFRRLACGLLLALLCLIATALSSRDAPARPMTFAVGARTYTVTFSARDMAFSAEPLRISSPDVRALRTRTIVTVPFLQNGAPRGAVTLTLDETADGVVYYLQSDVPATIDTVLCTPRTDGLRLRTINFGDTAAPETWAAPLLDTPYGADTALYLEGDDIALKTNRVTQLQDLGQTVYARTVPQEGVTLREADDQLIVSLPLTVSGNATLAATGGVICDDTLVHWYAKDAPGNVIWLDAAENDYLLLADGVYMMAPDSYRPRLPGSLPHVYKTPAALLLGPCSYPENGPMFTALGHSMLYSYLDGLNEQGFLPTAPSSTWLFADYGIGAGFYDTRFNFDTMKKLMRSGTVWDEPAVAPALDRMLRYYTDFAAGCRFMVDGIPFVPDYAPASFDRETEDTRAHQRPACSLNHYLTEGLLLLRAGDAYGNASYTAQGMQILRAIDESADRWIRANNDLWYAIRQDGVMEKADYVTVTYYDLLDAVALLHKMELLPDFEGIQNLLRSKERWLVATERGTLVRPHVPFTLAS